MTSPQQAAKRRGSAFEVAVMKWFRSKNVNAERLRLAGKQDEGDIVAFVSGRPYVFELKNTARLDLPRFWREACDEVVNYAKARNITPVPPAYIIVKRRNAGTEEAWVVTSLETWLGEHENR